MLVVVLATVVLQLLIANFQPASFTSGLDTLRTTVPVSIETAIYSRLDAVASGKRDPCIPCLASAYSRLCLCCCWKVQYECGLGAHLLSCGKAYTLVIVVARSFPMPQAVGAVIACTGCCEMWHAFVLHMLCDFASIPTAFWYMQGLV